MLGVLQFVSKIFGCKAEMQIITICYYKNYLKGYRIQR